MRRLAIPWALLCIGLPALVGSCLNFASFACDQDSQCDANDGGVCADGGHCAYPDADCPGGLRYDQHADGAVAGACVGEVGTTGTDSVGTSAGPTSLDTTLETTTPVDTTDTPTTGSGSDSGTDTGTSCGGAGEPCCDDGAPCTGGLSCLGQACGCVAQIEAGERHTCAVLTTGEALCWGSNDLGQLGDSANPFESAPIPAVAVVPDDPIRQISAVDHTCVRSEQGNVRCFGSNGAGQVDPALAQATAPTTPATWIPSADRVATGVSHTCAADGVSMACWGSNGASQLTGVDPGPGPVSAGTGPLDALELGGSFGCLVQGGVLSCWGANNQGQLATDPVLTPTLPTPTAMPVADVAAVALGRTHVCALTSGGAISCWGRNDEGQLGDGSGAQQLAPVAVAWPPEAGVPIAIEAGDQHTCAIDDAAALWCWGSNGNGQLMLEPDKMGFDGYTLVPVRIDVGAGVLAVTGGVTHTCALTDAAEVLCWGTNSAGQIGDGTTNYAFEPQPVALVCP